MNTNATCCLLVLGPHITSCVTRNRLSARLAKAELRIKDVIIPFRRYIDDRLVALCECGVPGRIVAMPG